MSMRQKGIKNVNKNDRSGPEAPNTTHSGLRWMNSRKSGNLALLMKPQPEHYTTLKRPWTFRFKKLSGLYLCWCHYIFFPPRGNLDSNNESSFVCLSTHQSIMTDPGGMMHVISLFWHFINYTYCVGLRGGIVFDSGLQASFASTKTCTLAQWK